MSEIFFTSDTHFNHNQEFIYGARGFNSPVEMGEAIVERWNDIVSPEDTVYHLGDFAFGRVDSPEFESTLRLIRQLNGNIIWISGNHDSNHKIRAIWDVCPTEKTNNHIYFPIWAHQVKIGKFTFYLSHYPTLTANFDDKHFSQHVIALHGHTHQTKNFLFPDNPFCYHVGVDSHNCTPVHVDEVLSDVRNRWNELGMNTPLLNTALR